MTLSFARRPRALALLGLVLVSLAAPATALADTLTVDGDGVAPVGSASLELGMVCLGDTVMDTALVALNATGHPGAGSNTFANGATITVDVVSTSGSGLSASDPAGSITLPMNWTSLNNGTLSNALSSTVTFTPTSSGSFAGSVLYAASGERSTGGTLVRTGSVQVSADVIDCTPGATPTPTPAATPRPAATPTPTPPLVGPATPTPAPATPTPAEKTVSATPPSTTTFGDGGSRTTLAVALFVVGALALGTALIAVRPRRD